MSRGETKVDEERGFPSLLERSPGFARKIDDEALRAGGKRRGGRKETHLPSATHALILTECR